MFVFGNQQMNKWLTKVKDYLLVATSHDNKKEGESSTFIGFPFCWEDDHTRKVVFSVCIVICGTKTEPNQRWIFRVCQQIHHVTMHTNNYIFFIMIIFPDSACLQWREVYEKDTDWGSLYLAWQSGSKEKNSKLAQTVGQLYTSTLSRAVCLRHKTFSVCYKQHHSKTTVWYHCI